MSSGSMFCPCAGGVSKRVIILKSFDVYNMVSLILGFRFKCDEQLLFPINDLLGPFWFRTTSCCSLLHEIKLEFSGWYFIYRDVI